MQADPALKIGALFCIDSICQQVGEPYVSYFSTNIAQVCRACFLSNMSAHVWCPWRIQLCSLLMYLHTDADVLGNMEICKW